MILEMILDGMRIGITFLLGILPNIPEFPPDVITGMDYFVGLVTGVIGLISYLESPAITIFAFTSILILLNFDNIHKLVLWVIHKVRG